MALNPNKYQYNLDKEGLAGPPAFGWHNHDYDDGAPLGLHFDNLFDQDHDEAGEHYDWATGRKIDNSTYDGTESLRIIGHDVDLELQPTEVEDTDAVEKTIAEILGPLPEPAPELEPSGILYVIEGEGGAADVAAAFGELDDFWSDDREAAGF